MPCTSTTAVLRNGLGPAPALCSLAPCKALHPEPPRHPLGLLGDGVRACGAVWSCEALFSRTWARGQSQKLGTLRCLRHDGHGSALGSLHRDKRGRAAPGRVDGLGLGERCPTRGLFHSSGTPSGPKLGGSVSGGGWRLSETVPVAARREVWRVMDHHVRFGRCPGKGPPARSTRPQKHRTRRTPEVTKGHTNTTWLDLER